ncbi:6-pyruvoyl tetrahydropterin synthase family protein [Roseivirga sp. BDSF3-8]|uniref:6-pyruvoyl trahydropterin synthase family protein n=1 Tax=Roseivirga sp. BDSF3-8 TaxID=3241598 RepID=UPI003531D1CD
MIASLCRKAHFNAAYTNNNPHWNVEKNTAVFGKTQSGGAQFHGHNYELVVRLEGEVNENTGRVFHPDKLAYLIKREVEERYDHKNLYEDVDDFRDTVPTPEMMACKIFNLLRPHIAEHIHMKVTLYESSQTFAEYEGR